MASTAQRQKAKRITEPSAEQLRRLRRVLGRQKAGKRTLKQLKADVRAERERSELKEDGLIGADEHFAPAVLRGLIADQDDISAGLNQRLQYLFRTTASWSVRGMQDAIDDARRNGTTMVINRKGDRRPIIRPDERVPRKALMKALQSFGGNKRDNLVSEYNSSKRSARFGRKKGQKVPKTPTSFRYRSSIWVPAPRVQYQMDIVYNTLFEGANYAMGVIDVNSRFAVVKALEGLDNATKERAFLEIMEEMGPPERLNVDNEFDTEWMRAWARDNNVELILSDPDNAINNKNAIIESFWKVWRKILQKMAPLRDTSQQQAALQAINEATDGRAAAEGRVPTAGEIENKGEPASNGQRGYPWESRLPQMLAAYNNKKHFTTKEKPIDIWNGSVPNRQTIQVAKPALKVGDYVKILLKRKAFRKNEEDKYTNQLFRLAGHPPRSKKWLLNDLDGKPRMRGKRNPRVGEYSEEELLKVDPSRVEGRNIAPRQADDSDDEEVDLDAANQAFFGDTAAPRNFDSDDTRREGGTKTYRKAKQTLKRLAKDGGRVVGGKRRRRETQKLRESKAQAAKRKKRK